MTHPGGRPASAARFRAKAAPLIPAFILGLMLVVFVFDAFTPADNVSICFAYAVPIVLSILEGGRKPLLYAALASLLSFVGSFIQPPNDEITTVFFANRVIAVATQWIMALLVRYRLEREEALNQSLREQSEKIQQQQRFIAMLSHEVRTPLTVMDGQAYRLLKRSGDIGPEDIANRARKIREAAARVNSIISAVLASTAIGEMGIVATRVPFDLKALLAQVIQNATEEGAVVTGDLDQLPPLIDGDATLLFQVFENILSNAVKYTPPGSPVTVIAQGDGADVTVRVCDEGGGIDPDDLAKLFTPYFRGSNSRGVPGAGIGLYLVERCVAAHGGSVAIDSRQGVGTTVTVRLPYRSSQEEGSPRV